MTMDNEELEEKKLNDFLQNTVVRVEMTVEQASDIYACLVWCAKMFRKTGWFGKAEDLETLADGLLGKRD